jgi:signal transduction histidine kinase/DNA-binding response OmpR family regulator
MKPKTTPVNLQSREGLALSFALAVVLLIAFLSYRSWNAFGRHADQVDVTRRTIAGINEFLLAVTNAETGQRGFLLTGEDRYLAPYRKACVDIPRILESLRTVTMNRPDQAQRLKTLNPLIDSKLRELALTIELRRTKGFDAAIAVVHTDRGRLLMAQVRGICSEILVVTDSRLADYSKEAQSSVDQGGLISVLGGASLFLLLLLAHVAIQRDAARRQSMIGELQQSERRLESLAEEAESANRAKSTFLSTMSHEIRTPMNAILGYAQLMLRDPGLGADAKANLKIIGQSGEHLLRLINDILDMSKIEAGRTEINAITFNLSRVLDDIAAMVKLRAEAKALSFEMLVDGESVPYVSADESKIRQVLINLLGNGIKFTKRGYVKLHVTLEKRSADRLWLSARIEDSGSGITAQEQEKLFEPFRQSQRGLNTQEGTGLGLAISRQFALLMGGDITVSSNPGRGSLFRFEVPIESGDASVAVRLSNARRVLGIRAATHSPRILVVDDQLENRDWLMKLLTSIGFSVRGAENGHAAVCNWQEWNPELILMDVHMPVMDGLEATRRIKAEPGGRETAIVVLTASALDEDRRSVAKSGADDFLSKPCREDELLEKMRAHLDIVYDYEEASVTPDPPLNGAGPSSERLARLPLKLVEELRDATVNGNKRLLDELILKLGATDGGCAHALRELADKYEYDALTQLLDEACRR